ncbi:dual specificity protein phosphatase family protein [Rhodobacteraceae bacterium]|nr:dual specificity protein phosphatase family protein [Paracoccaceae bacterium]
MVHPPASDTIRHFLPHDTPDTEAREDDRPLLIKVHDLATSGPPSGVDALWLGNLRGVEDPQALAQAGITASLNLAMNIFPGPLVLPDGTSMRRYQLGLLDGAGNMPQMLAAAVLCIDAQTAGYTTPKPHYPPHARGGLVVHCRGGRSRSVTALALWLCQRCPVAYGEFGQTLARLRQIRGLDDTYPLRPMIDLGKAVLADFPLPARAGPV